MTGVLALLVLVAATVALAWLKVRFAPAPVYDWPVWAYRVALAVRALLQRVSGTVPR